MSRQQATAWLGIPAGVLALGLASCTGTAEVPAGTVDRCAGLAAMELIDFDIVSAGPVPAEDDRPAHCRVDGLIDTEINFELLLPDDWNGRFMMGGGGGYVGTVQNSALRYGAGPGALKRGYATVGTDTGQRGPLSRPAGHSTTTSGGSTSGIGRCIRLPRRRGRSSGTTTAAPRSTPVSSAARVAGAGA